MLNLSGSEQGRLSVALRSAFNPRTFEDMLRHRLNVLFYEKARMMVEFPTAVADVISAANMEGWVDQLIASAREAVPGNSKLLVFSQQYGLASFTGTYQELQREIVDSNLFLDIDVWLKKLGETETRVCRIEIQTDQGKIIYGTGFLFGRSNLILTNHHVMESVIAGRNNEKTSDGFSARPENVICRFDFKRTIDGTVVNRGTTYRLSADWHVASSPNYPLDQEPPADRLDYALIRLEGDPGEDAVGSRAEPESVKRGFIHLPDYEHEFGIGSPLFILQHPGHEPLKLALDTNAIIGLNRNGTRVTYRTNTANGSSGSPCFSQKLELIALHHSGDPDFDPAHKPAYNEGIPISAIISLMKGNGVYKIFQQ